MRDCRRWGLWLTLSLVVTLPGAPITAQADEPVASLKVQADQGEPLPARVTLISPGQPYPDLAVFFTDAKGRCALRDAPDGECTLQVDHGPEWSIERIPVTIDKARGRTLTVPLKRLYDLKSHGYYQGDCHMHSTASDGKQSPADVAFHCRCEGLDFAFITDHETIEGHGEYMSQAVEGFLPLGGQEITTSHGHILGLGVTQVVSRDVSRGALDMARIFQQVREQSAVSVVAHPMVPTMSYVHWSVDDYDAIEILNGSAPPYAGLFDMVQARLKWHALLNDGKRVPALGNSDNHDNYNGIVRRALQNPEAAIKRDPRMGLLWSMPNRDEVIIPWAMKGLFIGTYRTCLKLDSLAQTPILDAIRAGRGFVTNGPIVVVTANDTDPGGEVRGTSATLCYDAACNRGLHHLAIVADGEIVQSVDLRDKTRAQGEINLDLRDITWFTVECYGTWPEFATTNAFYVDAQQ